MRTPVIIYHDTQWYGEHSKNDLADGCADTRSGMCVLYSESERKRDEDDR